MKKLLLTALLLCLSCHVVTQAWWPKYENFGFKTCVAGIAVGFGLGFFVATKLCTRRWQAASEMEENAEKCHQKTMFDLAETGNQYTTEAESKLKLQTKIIEEQAAKIEVFEKGVNDLSWEINNAKEETAVYWVAKEFEKYSKKHKLRVSDSSRVLSIAQGVIILTKQKGIFASVKKNENYVFKWDEL
jgi:hypothetical protein